MIAGPKRILGENESVVPIKKPLLSCECIEFIPDFVEYKASEISRYVENIEPEQQQNFRLNTVHKFGWKGNKLRRTNRIISMISNL